MALASICGASTACENQGRRKQGSKIALVTPQKVHVVFADSSKLEITAKVSMIPVKFVFTQPFISGAALNCFVPVMRACPADRSNFTTFRDCPLQHPNGFAPNRSYYQAVQILLPENGNGRRRSFWSIPRVLGGSCTVPQPACGEELCVPRSS